MRNVFTFRHLATTLLPTRPTNCQSDTWVPVRLLRTPCVRAEPMVTGWLPHIVNWWLRLKCRSGAPHGTRRVSELLRFRSCWRLQFIAQLVGAFDGVYDRAIGTRGPVTQSFGTPAVFSFFYPRPGRLSDRGPGFPSALASG